MDDSVIEKYHQQKIQEELKGIVSGIKSSIESVERESEHGKIVKTIPLSKYPEWLAIYEELNSMAHELAKEIPPIVTKMKKAKVKSGMLWGLIQTGLDDYRDMHINQETRDIEIFEK